MTEPNVNRLLAQRSAAVDALEDIRLVLATRVKRHSQTPLSDKVLVRYALDRATNGLTDVGLAGCGARGGT